MRNLMKKSVFIALVTVICLSSVFCCEASNLSEQIFVTVKVNDKHIKMDTQPYIKDNRTYVSVRFVAEALGSRVDWIAEQRKVIISKKEDLVETVSSSVYADQNKTIQLVIGSKELIAYGENKQMDVVPEIVDGRTMLPIRFVSENLDCDVKWDELTYCVSINKEGVDTPEELIDNKWYTDEDLMWLARIIQVEVGGLSVNGRVGVANVVINRVKSPEFPNNVHDVIFASGQFPPANKAGFKELVPRKECFIAAKMALNGINNVENCLFFNHVPFKSTRITLYERIDGEYFYSKK